MTTVLLILGALVVGFGAGWYVRSHLSGLSLIPAKPAS